jgi:nitrate reductase gamma subunit
MPVLAWLLYRLLPYLALGVCLAGIVWRLVRLARTPVALAVPLWPAPQTRLGWLGRLAAAWAWWPGRGEVQGGWWLVAGLFHLSLLLVLLAHLRLLVNPVPSPLVWLAQAGKVAGWAFVASLVLLLLWRLISPVPRRLTTAGHWLVLGLLLALALSGLGLRHWLRPDLVAVKRLTWGLVCLETSAPPLLSPLMTLHLLLGLALVAVFPFTRLVHGLWLVFSPLRALWRSRDQVLANPWDQDFQGDLPSEEALRPGEPGLYTLERYREHLRRLRAQSQEEGGR